MQIKLMVGLLVLFCAVAISAVAAYFSVVGLAALFAAAFLPVAIMGAILEGSKLVAAGWLHSNWHNPRVGRFHKAYLVTAVISLMAITSMGIYGYLARAHLEQSTPSAALQLDIDQKQTQIDQLVAQRDQLLVQQKTLNETVGTYLESGAATAASRFMRQQRSQQDALQSQIAELNDKITEANVALIPLKKDAAGAEAKLGPLKYIAKALGLKDPESAVIIVILMLMFAFDPLAVVMMISGTITIGEWQRSRQAAASQKSTPDISTLSEQIDEQNVHPEFSERISERVVEVDDVPEVIHPPKPSSIGTIDPDIDRLLSPGLVKLTHPAQVEFGSINVDPVTGRVEHEQPSLLTKEDDIDIQEPDMEPDAKAQLVSILESRPELLDELVQAVEEVRKSKIEDDPQPPPTEIPWLDPK